MRRLRAQESRLVKYRGVVLVVCIPVGLILAVMLLMPRASLDTSVPTVDPFDREAFGSSQRRTSYAVVFDAGSSGSRVHVYKFNRKLELVTVGDGLELFKYLKPGLSSYAVNPKNGSESLRPLLNDALEVVPENARARTPVRLGATAGLRALPGGKADEILHEVRNVLRESEFKFTDSWVSILDGADEGSFQWVTVNYLLGRLGKDYSETVGIVDLGGGSVQMAYAIAEEDASKAPKAEAGEDAYIKTLELLGKTYHLYVHSYLHFGLLAARAEVLKLVQNEKGCSCITKGFEGDYSYGGDTFRALPSAEGADAEKCGDLVTEALAINQTCNYLKCTFKGIWNGGGGAGQKRLFVASFFFDRAAEAGIIKNPDVAEADVKPADYREAARSICSTSHKDMPKRYPRVQSDNLPYICLDIMYQYTLLVKGFGIDPNQQITLVKKLKYKGYDVEAAWPLGSAIEVVSAPAL